MEIAKLYENIQQFCKMVLNAPAKKVDIAKFERENNISLPDELQTLSSPN